MARLGMEILQFLRCVACVVITVSTMVLVWSTSQGVLNNKAVVWGGIASAGVEALLAIAWRPK